MTKTKCEVFSRVVGYLRPVENWNDSKQEEWKDRKVFELESNNNNNKGVKQCKII